MGALRRIAGEKRKLEAVGARGGGKSGEATCVVPAGRFVAVRPDPASGDTVWVAKLRQKVTLPIGSARKTVRVLWLERGGRAGEYRTVGEDRIPPQSICGAIAFHRALGGKRYRFRVSELQQIVQEAMPEPDLTEPPGAPAPPDRPAKRRALSGQPAGGTQERCKGGAAAASSALVKAGPRRPPKAHCLRCHADVHAHGRETHCEVPHAFGEPRRGRDGRLRARCRRCARVFACNVLASDGAARIPPRHLFMSSWSVVMSPTSLLLMEPASCFVGRHCTNPSALTPGERRMLAEGPACVRCVEAAPSGSL